MPNGNQFGSFGNVTPEGMSSIRRAIERRQGGGSVPALGQQSSASPTMSPLPSPTTVPQTAAGPSSPQPQAPTQQTAGSQFPDPEIEIILKAMSQFLRSKTNVSEARAGVGKGGLQGLQPNAQPTLR